MHLPSDLVESLLITKLSLLKTVAKSSRLCGMLLRKIKAALYDARVLVLPS